MNEGMSLPHAMEGVATGAAEGFCRRAAALCYTCRRVIAPAGIGQTASGPAPAALAAALTSIRPGMSGPRTGSMMTSESSALPSSCASPLKMPATYMCCSAQFRLLLFPGGMRECAKLAF